MVDLASSLFSLVNSVVVPAFPSTKKVALAGSNHFVLAFQHERSRLLFKPSCISNRYCMAFRFTPKRFTSGLTTSVQVTATLIMQ